MNVRSMWKKINRCVVCGEKLQFRPSIIRTALPEEGTRYCANNHAEFGVYGHFDAQGQWNLDWRMPR